MSAGGPSVALMDSGIRIVMDQGTAEMYAHEARGAELVNSMIDRAGMLGRVPLHPQRPKIVGPDFDYATSRGLFSGRVGRGPLRIALDTNIVIDYFELGEELWSGRSTLPLKDDQEHAEDLEALQLVLATWVLREIQFVMLKETLNDSKKGEISTERARRNRNGWREFYRALTHSPEGMEPRVDQILPSVLVDEVLTAIPAGGDRRMVRGALLDGAHVYLTRDQRVLRAQSLLRPLGLSTMNPGQLLEELSSYGALNFLWDPASLYWPLPDQEKVAHLIWALPSRSV